MSWKVGWGEPLLAEEAIASLCHRRLDPLSLVHFQEVLTTRWQDAHPRRTHASHAPSFPRHSVRQSSSMASPTQTSGPVKQGAPSLPKIEKPATRSLPQLDDAPHHSWGYLPSKSRDVSVASLDPISPSRPSSKFGATMRNSSSLSHWSETDRLRHTMRHATDVRVPSRRSRQGSKTSNKSSRGGHSLDPI